MKKKDIIPYKLTQHNAPIQQPYDRDMDPDFEGQPENDEGADADYEPDNQRYGKMNPPTRKNPEGGSMIGS